MTTHKELVRQLAEKMAEIDYIEVYGTPVDKKDKLFEMWVQKRMSLAKNIAIEFGAKMFEEGYMSGYNGASRCGDKNRKCKERMQERGLIAEKEVEDAD